MLSYVLRRLGWMVPTWVGTTLVVFLALHAAPGDPATAAEGPGAEVAPGAGRGPDEAAFRARHLLDQPFARQYLHFLGPFSMARDGHRWFGGSGEDPWHGVLALDLGDEMHRPGAPVVGEILKRLRVTLPLALAAVLLSFGLAIPLGVHAAVRRGAPLERGLTASLFVLHSVPAFWGGLMLILLFGAAGLDWLPAVGLESPLAAELSWERRLLDRALHGVLPVATLTYGTLAYLSRQMRAGMLEVLHSDFVRTARAKGVPPRRVLLAHALPGALPPILTLLGAVLPALVGGSIVVETLFDLPGMGRYAYEGLQSRDFNVVMATTAFATLLTLFGTLLADLGCAWLDPRIRHGLVPR